LNSHGFEWETDIIIKSPAGGAETNIERSECVSVESSFMDWPRRLQHTPSNTGCAVVPRDNLHRSIIVGGASFANFLLQIYIVSMGPTVPTDNIVI